MRNYEHVLKQGQAPEIIIKLPKENNPFLYFSHKGVLAADILKMCLRCTYSRKNALE